jgi:C4-dicarboxylate-specific signal transduction histidine kinase
VQKTLTRIRDQAARAASAMTGVVALSRAQPDGATYLVDMCDVATRAVELRRYSIGRADLTVQLEVPPEPQLVTGQRLHLLQVALNMIQNAEQALAPRRSGCIRVEVAGEGDHVVLRVSDDGPGVPPADADRIFQPFVTSEPRPSPPGSDCPSRARSPRPIAGRSNSRPSGRRLVPLRVPKAPASEALQTPEAG